MQQKYIKALCVLFYTNITFSASSNLGYDGIIL